MSYPLLTIAIPTYNRAKMLDECLSKMAHEIKGHNCIELIVSNNGSNDNTCEVVAHHKNLNFPYLQYFENETNLGPDANIMSCFRKATGKYVWIFSDDDYLLPGYITDLLNILSESEWGLVHLKSLWYKGDSPIVVKDEFTYEVFKDKIDFVQKIHYWVTFITGNIVNKHILANSKFTYSFEDTYLAQLGWVIPAIFASEANIIVNNQIVACRSGNTGGYKLFKIFSINFNMIMSKLVSVGVMPNVCRRIINNNLIVHFFPPFIRESGGAFLSENILQTLLIAFGGYSKFWTVLLPLYFEVTRSNLIEKVKKRFNS